MQLTFREIEKVFEVEEKTLYRWLNTEKMPTIKANDQYYFNPIEVLEWALKKRIVLTPGALKLCERECQGKDIFTSALIRGGIHFGVQGNSREEILEKILDFLPLPNHIQRPFLKEMLLSREQMGTTALGDGIAIPHIKHPVVLAGMEPMVGLFFLESPIDFAAFDHKKVHTLFVILSASFKEHLSLLSRMAFCLQREDLKLQLSHYKTKEEILAAFQVVESRIVGASE